MGDLDYVACQIIARIGFPIIDRLFPQGYNLYKFPILINPEFAERQVFILNLKNMELIKQVGILTSDIFMRKEKNILKMFFSGMQVIHLLQNFLYGTPYGNEIQPMIYVSSVFVYHFQKNNMFKME